MSEKQSCDNSCDDLVEELARNGFLHRELKQAEEDKVCPQLGCDSNEYYVHYNPNREIIIGEEQRPQITHCSCKECSTHFSNPSKYFIGRFQKDHILGQTKTDSGHNPKTDSGHNPNRPLGKL
jgi:hypothetical protein